MNPPSAQRRKILFVTTELRAGGTERCVTQLACGLDPDRFSTEVVCLAPPPTERTQFFDQLRDRNVPLHSLQLRSSWQFAGARHRLQKLVGDSRPDVICSFLFHANLLTALAIGGASSPRQIANIRVADPRRWRLPVERWVLRRTERIVCVSQSVQDYCVQVGKFPANKLRVIPNGVDVGEIRHQLESGTADSRQASAGPHVGFAGRLDYQKGIDRLLRSWRELLESFPRARLWIAGSGPDEESLRKLASELRLGDSIQWLGWQSQPWAALSHCQLLVFPSRWEGMSNSLLEAMATGKPVVATAIQGVREVLGAGPACQLAEIDDSQHLAQLIAQVLSDQQLANEAGQFNRRIIEERFTLSAMIQHFQQQIEEVL